MAHRDIVVIGGSAGSLESLQNIITGFPRDLAASILVVIHMSADFPSLLAHQFTRWGKLPATPAVDKEPLKKGHIYVARPDHHLTLEGHRLRVQRGPRENRHRPAVDALFRTAAREYGPRVVGVVLSGLRDDGSAGLYAVKQRGGVAIVQDPRDAPWDEMPRNALEYASPHYVLRTEDIAPTLTQLLTADNGESVMTRKHTIEKYSGNKAPSRNNGSKKASEPDENLQTAYNDEGEGMPSVFACPECHGVLWEIKDKKVVRFRCRVGHSYGTESLARELSHASEAALWAAMRALEEKAAMQLRLADRLSGNKMSARRLHDQSKADESNARLIRDMIFERDAELETESEIHEAKKTA